MILFNLYPPFKFYSSKDMIEDIKDNIVLKKPGYSAEKLNNLAISYVNNEVGSSNRTLKPALKNAPQTKPSKRLPLKNFDYPMDYGGLNTPVFCCMINLVSAGK